LDIEGPFNIGPFSFSESIASSSSSMELETEGAYWSVYLMASEAYIPVVAQASEHLLGQWLQSQRQSQDGWC
jgi:hypothetical protein